MMIYAQIKNHETILGLKILASNSHDRLSIDMSQFGHTGMP